jgi:hypothetical protein
MNGVSNMLSGFSQYESLFQNIAVPIIVSLIAGTSAAVASIFGNKKINDLNRAKYEIIIDNKTKIQIENLKNEFVEKFSKLIENQEIMKNNIDNNTKAIKELKNEFSSIVDLDEEMNSIKREAQRWTKNECVLLDLLTSKANSMSSLFNSLLKIDYKNLTLNSFKSEMQVEIVKVKNEWEKILKDNNMDYGFIDYFYTSSHTKHIDSFLNNVSYLLSPRRKINGINVEKELKESCIKFFRVSCENLLCSWDAYRLKGN